VPIFIGRGAPFCQKLGHSKAYRFAAPIMFSHAMRWASLVTFLCLTGCGNGFVWDEVLDGPYRLVAVDIDEDMSLCRSVDMSDMRGNCAGDGLPDATVFQAGWSPKYIVVARHPRIEPQPANRSITEFYYIVRQPNEMDPRTRISPIGPLNEIEYQREKERLQLPDFTRVFKHLK
jgi:hypothetical protein